MKYVLPFGLLLAVACGGENEATVISEEDFFGQTGQIQDSALNTTIDENLFISDVERFGHKMLDNYDTITGDEFSAFDRFSYSTKRKLVFKGKHEVNYGKTTKVIPTAEFFYYTFKDSTSAKNAFYNYLDQLAPENEGGPVLLNKDIEAIKHPPMWMFVYDTVIIDIQFLCEHAENNWKPFKDSLIKVFGNDYKYHMTVECGGPLKWIKEK